MHPSIHSWTILHSIVRSFRTAIITEWKTFNDWVQSTHPTNQSIDCNQPANSFKQPTESINWNQSVNRLKSTNQCIQTTHRINQSINQSVHWNQSTNPFKQPTESINQSVELSQPTNAFKQPIESINQSISRLKSINQPSTFQSWAQACHTTLHTWAILWDFPHLSGGVWSGWWVSTCSRRYRRLSSVQTWRVCSTRRSISALPRPGWRLSTQL